MRHTLPVALCAFALALIAAPVAAQDEEATATHIVMRYWKCNPQGQGIRLMQQGRSAVQEMVDEGLFVNYGVMAHNWGDEWNVVDWFAVDGLASFFENFPDVLPRVNAAAEAEGDSDLPPFREVCTEHKDNIYSIVQPPSGD